jgi:hypothetical protein
MGQERQLDSERCTTSSGAAKRHYVGKLENRGLRITLLVIVSFHEISDAAAQQSNNCKVCSDQQRAA